MTKAFKKTLPAELVKHITAMCGERGERWFEELPGTIAELEAKWNFTARTPFPGIEYNYVAAAQRPTGEEVVLKIAPPLKSPRSLQKPNICER